MIEVKAIKVDESLENMWLNFRIQHLNLARMIFDAKIAAEDRIRFLEYVSMDMITDDYISREVTSFMEEDKEQTRLRSKLAATALLDGHQEKARAIMKGEACV